MAERSLKKNRENLRVAVIRPSIIISCYEEPCRGWTDSLAAGGGLTWSIQMGLMRYVKTNTRNPDDYWNPKYVVCDLIPCDFVSNMVIANTVYTA